MKKSYLLVLALAAIISVSACSETSSSLSPSSEEPSETTSQVEPSQEPSSVDPTSEEQPSSEEPSSVNPSSEQPSSEEPSISVAQDYAINVDAPNTVTIEVAEQATEGSTDTFTVTVNYPRKTELVSVKVNDFTLQPDGNSYSFTMPEENIFVELQLDVTPYKLSLEVTGVQTIIDYNIYDIENDEVRITKDSYVKA